MSALRTDTRHEGYTASRNKKLGRTAAATGLAVTLQVWRSSTAAKASGPRSHPLRSLELEDFDLHRLLVFVAGASLKRKNESENSIRGPHWREGKADSYVLFG